MTRKLELYRSVLHPTAAATVAWLSVVAGIYLTGGLVPGWTPPVMLAVLAVLAAVVEAVVGTLLQAHRAGGFARLRELALLLLVTYPIVSLVGPGPFGARFSPSVRHLAWLSVITLSWGIAYSLHRLLHGREGLLATFRDLRGEPLRAAIIERQRYMAAIIGELRRTRNIGGVLATLLAALVITSVLVGSGAWQGVSPAGFVLFVLYSLCYVGLLAVVHAFIDEYAANGEGISVPATILRRRFLAAAGVVSAAALAAFLMSRNRSVLSLQMIADFFAWLRSFFQPSGEPPPPEFLTQTQTPGWSPEVIEMLREMEQQEPSLFLQILVRLLQRAVVAIAAAAVVLFIFGPLFSRSFRSRLRALRPAELIRTAWLRLFRRLSLWWRFLKWRARHRRSEQKRNGGGPPDAGALPEGDAELQRYRKRRQTDRVVGAFLAVVRWARRHGVRYRESQGAGEFLSLIRTRHPELMDATGTVIEVFNEAKYSPALVPHRRMRSYHRAVREITRSTGS